VRRLSAPQWVLVGLLAAVVALVAVELGLGALGETSPKIADPCRPRNGRTGGFDTTIQRIVLDGLDGAACRLHTTREELVLSLAHGPGAPRLHLDRSTTTAALRAGMLRAVDDAERRGDLPSFIAPLLRRLVERAPIEQLLRGAAGLGGLFGSG
jgi:hypothetical protein